MTRRSHFPRMKIRVDSDEYKCWHEVGHASVCLHLGGDVEFIEFLYDDARGHARTRTMGASEMMDRTVSFGGFAAEFYLLKNGFAEQDPDDKRDINRIPFHNATHDIEDFCGRKLGKDEDFTRKEKVAFMHYAIGPDDYGDIIPIFDHSFPRMQDLVRELLQTRRVEGRRVKELLRLGMPR